MAFPTKGGPWICPFEGCPGLAATRTAMWVYFLHRHVQDTVVILEEGKLSQPLCESLSNPGIKIEVQVVHFRSTYFQ